MGNRRVYSDFANQPKPERKYDNAFEQGDEYDKYKRIGITETGRIAKLADAGRNEVNDEKHKF